MNSATREFRNWPTWIALVLVWTAISWSVNSMAAESTGGTVPVGVSESPGPPGKTEPVASEEPIPTANLWHIIQQGGLLMIPIALCSLLLLAFVFVGNSDYAIIAVLVLVGASRARLLFI